MRHDQPIEPSPQVIPELETDMAPQERWDSDILEDEGETKFISLMDEMKQACAAH
jgi:hypothetical protein